MKSITSKKVFLLFSILIFLSLFFEINTFSAPYDGELFTLKQPNGSDIKVKVYGDEFYQFVDSLEGETLIRDPKTNWICYAKLNSTITDFESTGLVYKNTLSSGRSAYTSVKKGIRLLPKIVREKALNERRRLQPSGQGRSASVLPSQVYIGNITGLTILIEFPDEKSIITQAQINNLLNKKDYSEFGNNGSVNDYFYKNSNGKLNFTNIVTYFYTAQKPKSYYDNNSPIGATAQELVKEAITNMNAKGFDFSKISTDQNGYVRSLNIMYAGSPGNGWIKGLWPHAWGINEVSLQGKKFSRYQMSNIGTDLNISTFCHENGHLLMGWPDTYDYGYESKGCGNYDLMASCTPKNPPPPNPYFRTIKAGWSTNIPLTKAKTVSIKANIANTYIYRTKNPEEFFIIENKNNSFIGSVSASGILIWHIDGTGDNQNQEMKASSHYMVSVEQADGGYDLERNGDPNPQDLFYTGNKTSFSAITKPSSKLWSGEDSGLSITKVSKSGSTMKFYFSKKISAPKK